MAGGILFPDIAGALSSGAQAGAASAQNRFLNEERAARQEIAPLVPQALAGDKDALGKIATRHPDTAMKLAPLLERLDAGQRTKAKEYADYITTSGMAILNAPPEQQPGLYARVRQEAQASGRDVSQWPTTYDPSWIKFNVDKAMPVSEFYKRSGEGVTFSPPAGGALGGGDRAGNAIGGIESGGRYDAVGPAANDKGQRAYGKYQIMDFNVGPWTQEVLGQAMTPQQFLANPQAQDAVFKAKFAQYEKQYGSPEAASRAWFAGPGGMNNPGAKDVLGTSVQNYGQRFAQAYGPGATGAPPGVAMGSDMPAADGSGTPLPPAQQALAPLRGLQIPPGARVALQGGVPIVKDGNVLYLDANGGWGAAPLPTRAAPKEPGAGPFTGTGTEAQALNMLIANGSLTQQQAAELAAGKTITNPADGSVIFMTPSGLFGQRPGQPVQPVGAPTPQAAPVAQPGSGMIPVTPPKPQTMTEGQSNAALYADRMREADAIIAENEKAGMDIGGRALEAVPGGAGNFLQSDQYQLFEQARRNFINAVLRRESGAVIADTEFANAEKQYFPRPGDSEAVLKQKAANRRSAIDGISRAAGPTYKPTAESTPKAGGAEQGKMLFDARAAIQAGAPRDKVIERLRAAGITEEP
jgi:hypothetical protein